MKINLDLKRAKFRGTENVASCFDGLQERQDHITKKTELLYMYLQHMHNIPVIDAELWCSITSVSGADAWQSSKQKFWMQLRTV